MLMLTLPQFVSWLPQTGNTTVIKMRLQGCKPTFRSLPCGVTSAESSEWFEGMEMFALLVSLPDH